MSTKAVMRSLVVRVDYLLEVICPDGAKDHDDPPAAAWQRQPEHNYKDVIDLPSG